ncbi:DedA family protein [Dactylosporangium sp. NPDC051484]|uniref:DedA family protein n=1 Tax=Dactylosporangium sp. NPDC051484 TaxID=3154942 RepID=UPI003450BBE7
MAGSWPMEHFEQYGYPALALLVLLEGVGIPTPAVSVVVAASALAAHGRLWLPAVVAITFLAAVAGDNLGYLLGRRAGRPVILRYGRRVGLTEPRLARAERFVATRGINIIVVARFIDGLRQTNGLIAGATALPWPRYAIRDGIGAVLWTTLWVTVGAVAGNHLDVLRRFRFPVAAAALAIALFFLIRYLLRRRARKS